MAKQALEKVGELQALRKQMEEEPWIRFRNKLISELVNKRRELGVSQTELAKAMNIPNSSITRFESMVIMKKGEPVNPPNPTIKYIVSYAAALGLELDFSFTISTKQ